MNLFYKGIIVGINYKANAMISHGKTLKKVEVGGVYLFIFFYLKICYKKIKNFCSIFLEINTVHALSVCVRTPILINLLGI